MNELQIFRNSQLNYSEIEQLAIIGRMTITMAKAMEEAENEEKKKAIELLKLVSEVNACLQCDELNSVLFGIWEYCIRETQKTEFYYHWLFNKYIGDIITGCKPVKRRNDGRNIPDSWVEIEGNVLPVEVKFNNFDKRALNQLLRYVKTYKTIFGIAVARNLTVELPLGIWFVSIADLEKKHREKQKEIRIAL